MADEIRNEQFLFFVFFNEGDSVMTRLLLTLMCGICPLAVSPSAQAEVIVLHVGKNDPAGEGFIREGAGGTAVTNDLGLGVDAWKISDGWARYRRPLTAPELSDMTSLGWRARMEVRNLLAPDAGDDWGLHLEVSDEAYTYLIEVGAAGNGDPTLYHLTATSTATSGGYPRDEITLSNVTGSGYHLYEMVYNPASLGTVGLFVDGYFQATLSGAANDGGPWSKRLIFGATDGLAVCDANYSLVELTIVPEPSTLALLGSVAILLGLLVRPRRRGK